MSNKLQLLSPTRRHSYKKYKQTQIFTTFQRNLQNWALKFSKKFHEMHETFTSEIVGDRL